MPEPTGMRVGWIGTGAMGAPMCERLLGGGTTMSVWNRTRAKAEPLLAKGAALADSPGDLAAADIVFVIVTDAHAVEEVLTGDRGLLGTDRGPSIVVNCSTVTDAQSARLRGAANDAGVAFVAAPISASASMVLDGTAAIVSSGPRPAFDTVRPLLELIAPTVVYAGAGEEALLVKLCSNVLMATFTQALFEIADLSAAAGVERTAFLDFVNGSAIGSTYSRFKGRQYADGARVLAPHLRALMRRDFDDCLHVAHSVESPVPISGLVRELI